MAGPRNSNIWTWILIAASLCALYIPEPSSAAVIRGWGQYLINSAELARKDFIAISAGGDHSLALTADGSIIAWGNNEFGQAIPPPEKGFIAISA